MINSDKFYLYMGEFGIFIKITPYYTVALVGGGAFVIFDKNRKLKFFQKKNIEKSKFSFLF